MQMIKKLLLILCLPSMLLFGNTNITQDFPIYTNEAGKELHIPRDESGKVNPWELFKYENLRFQDQLDFLDALESEEFWASLDQEELDRVVGYLTWAMRNSAPTHRPDLQEAAEQAIADLEALMRGEYVEGYDDDDEEDELYFTTLYKHDPNIITCGWISNAWKHGKKWLKKHKKPLIAIGVVATVLVVGAVTGGIGASSAVAVGGALVGGDMNSPPDHINKPGEVITEHQQTPSAHISSNTQTPSTTPVIHEQAPLPTQHTEEQFDAIASVVDETKEELAETKNIATPHKISDFGCSIGHSIVDGVASISEYFYDGSSLEDYLSFIRSVDEYHEKVDNIFAYEDKELDTSKWQMQMGTPPVPGGKLVPAVAGVVAETTVGTAIVGSVVGNVASQAVVREMGNIAVYQATNEITGEVSYVGITNNIERRHLEHAREKGIDISEIDNLTNLTREDARAVEQTLIELHKLEKDGGTLINKINSIAKTNPAYAESLTKGTEILRETGYLE